MNLNNLNNVISDLHKVLLGINQNQNTKGNKKKRQSSGRKALGTNLSSPLNLKSQQFAAWTPLETFSVKTGSTPGGVRVCGRELLEPISSGSTTGAFSIGTTFNLNPVSFPRLVAYAPIYEMYVFHTARVMFQSNQPTTATGVTEIGIDYDVKDTAPTTTIGMMRNISSSMANIYADHACDAVKALSRLPKYTIQEDTDPDANHINQAVVYVAVEGNPQPDPVVIGYVVVEYDIEFFTPQ